MSTQPIFRFAPSPNGYLHLGHAYSALFTWQCAKALGGTALLRIEDIDTGRCRPQFEAAIYEDLAWLGLDWPQPVMRQSERFGVYTEAAKKLMKSALVYPCFCTRTEIAAAARGTDPDGAPLYPGACRHLGSSEVQARFAAGAAVQWRLRMAEAEEEIGDLLVVREIPVDDRALSDKERQRAAMPGRWGDVVLVRKGTPTSYHLSVVVDDAAQGVTHVTRGMDLEPATDIHVLLQALLGLPSPAYAHHGLLTDTAERKLAKSAGATGLRALREAGWTAQDVRRRLGFA